jgi:acyl-CoA-binding protein
MPRKKHTIVVLMAVYTFILQATQGDNDSEKKI